LFENIFECVESCTDIKGRVPTMVIENEKRIDNVYDKIFVRHTTWYLRNNGRWL
jgi:hypothetical protein